MSLKLTTSLSQRLVLTPQLRQRIEMLQMTSLELTDLIQQQLLENPVLEEVPSQEEVQEIAEKVLDHLASSESDTFEAHAPELGSAATNGAVARAEKTILIGSMGKREAQSKSREIMGTINRANYVVTSQTDVGRFLDEYATMHVDPLAASTRAKYSNHLRNHIRPAFASMMLCDLQPLTVSNGSMQKTFRGLRRPASAISSPQCSRRRSRGADGRTPIQSSAVTPAGNGPHARSANSPRTRRAGCSGRRRVQKSHTQGI